MAILVCGSLAFDTIMTFEGRFAEQILPSQLHILNVSFLVPALRREFGGCAGNIAYGLRQLGDEVVPLAAVGPDGQDYVARMKGLGVDTAHLQTVADSYTAQAMIMTDRDNNQITAFHPGAMSMAHENPVPARGDIQLAIISPDGRDAMLQHAEQLSKAGAASQRRGGDLGRARLRCVGRRAEDHGARRQGHRSAGPHGLRRRFPRRFAARFGTGLVLGEMRRIGQPHWCHQNRQPRRPELPFHRLISASGRVDAAHLALHRLPA
jgi:hypothetical protein